VARNVEALYDAVHSPSFPELDVEPQTDAEVDGVLLAAETWGRGVRTAHDQLVRLFSPHDPGGGVEYPADVLGQLSQEYVNPGAMGIALWLSIGREHHSLPTFPSEVDAYGDLIPGARIPLQPENWASIRELLREGWKAACGRALSLVAHLRERIERFESASLPIVEFVEVLPRSRVKLLVHCAGAAREVHVQMKAWEFLLELSRKAAVETIRNRKMALVDKVPELSRFIEPVGTAPAADADNYHRYRIASEMRERIRDSRKK